MNLSKKIFNKSILFWINILLVQFLFIRLIRKVGDNNIYLLFGVLPFTGFFGINYILLTVGYKYSKSVKFLKYE